MRKTGTYYTAYGLKIAAISSKKLGDINEGSLKNNNLYNDKELNDDADLNWYDYGFRSYDPQIGRFPQLDPLTDDYAHYTPYQYAGNEPIANVDLDGLEEYKVLQAVVVKGFMHSAAPLANAGKAVATVALGGGKLLENLAVAGKSLLTIIGATASVALDNLTGGLANTEGIIANSGWVPSSQIGNWNNAVKSANSAFVAFGLGESTLGGGIAAGSVSLTAGTLGASIEISGPAFLFGAGMALHGVAVTSNAARNLATGNGIINSESRSNGGGSSSSQPKYKRSKPGVSGKEGAKDIPDWARGERPFEKESGKKFARRLLDKKYGGQNYKTGPGTEYNKIQKWGDRSFE